MFIYHTIKLNENLSEIVESLANYGLCSPEALYKANKKLFDEYTKKIYLDRTAKYKNKNPKKITDKDILDFLNNSNKRYPVFTSKSIFFHITNPVKYSKTILKKITPFLSLQINSNVLANYVPIIVSPGPRAVESNWKLISNPYFLRLAEISAGQNIKTKYLFAPSIHIAVNCYKIDISQISGIFIFKNMEDIENYKKSIKKF